MARGWDPGTLPDSCCSKPTPCLPDSQPPDEKPSSGPPPENSPKALVVPLCRTRHLPLWVISLRVHVSLLILDWEVLRAGCVFLFPPSQSPTYSQHLVYFANRKSGRLGSIKAALCLSFMLYHVTLMPAHEGCCLCF